MALDPLTAGPPHDVETEAKVLACLFLMTVDDRSDLLGRIPVGWFHDPLHQWLFRGLRVWGAVYDDERLFENLAAFPGKPTSDSLACVVALTIFLRDGSCRVRYQMLPYYLTQLQITAEKRASYDEGIRLITENHHRDEPYPSSGLVR